MNIIEDIAQDFLQENYLGSENKNIFLSGLNTEVSRHKKEIDKIMFLSAVRNLIQEMHDEHFQNCKEREECSTLKWNLKSIHYVNNILEDYSVSGNKENFFTITEKDEYSKKIDKILEEIEILKKGQEITYDNISEEINELKNLYYLGKKNWKQIVTGKVVEMTLGGIISETISKELISLSDIAVQNLLK